jgi:hypothetical protein
MRRLYLSKKSWSVRVTDGEQSERGKWCPSMQLSAVCVVGIGDIFGEHFDPAERVVLSQTGRLTELNSALVSLSSSTIISTT